MSSCFAGTRQMSDLNWFQAGSRGEPAVHALPYMAVPILPVSIRSLVLFG